MMKRKRRKENRGDGERAGFKYVGDHRIGASSTAVIVYFAPALRGEPPRCLLLEVADRRMLWAGAASRPA